MVGLYFGDETVDEMDQEQSALLDLFAEFSVVNDDKGVFDE